MMNQGVKRVRLDFCSLLMGVGFAFLGMGLPSVVFAGPNFSKIRSEINEGTEFLQDQEFKVQEPFRILFKLRDLDLEVQADLDSELDLARIHDQELQRVLEKKQGSGESKEILFSLLEKLMKDRSQARDALVRLKKASEEAYQADQLIRAVMSEVYDYLRAREWVRASILEKDGKFSWKYRWLNHHEAVASIPFRLDQALRELELNQMEQIETIVFEARQKITAHADHHR
ncbi:MAG: hypothetical protein ACO3A2_05630 [Bdellovibrionia bacterium]